MHRWVIFIFFVQGHQGDRVVKASAKWLDSSSAAFSAGSGRSGCAHLKHYTAEYREWGDGPPLVLVPGLAGGFELLGPLARRLGAGPSRVTFSMRGGAKLCASD